jgi:hypothetical protein
MMTLFFLPASTPTFLVTKKPNIQDWRVVDEPFVMGGMSSR